MEKKASLLVVLGMHRSGTSCLAGSLQEAGVYLGEVHEWNPHNMKGNREKADVVALNDALLAVNLASWDHPPEDDLGWTKALADQRDQVLSSLQEGAHQLAARLIGFKDPRTLLTLPFWLEGANQRGLDYYFVGTFRNPLLVARSLAGRGPFPVHKALQLWISYNRRLLACWQQQAFPLLCFDVLPDDYYRDLQRVMSSGIPGHRLDIARLGFFDDGLRHGDHVEYSLDSSGERELFMKALQLYQQLWDGYKAQ